MTNLNSNVEEMAYLLVSDDTLGVSNDLNDITTFIKAAPEKEVIRIVKGSKDELLTLQQKILIVDCLDNDTFGNTLTVPERLNDYNLVSRNKSKKRLFTKLLE